MNLDLFGTKAYSESGAYSELWNIQNFDSIYITVKHIVISFGNGFGT